MLSQRLRRPSAATASRASLPFFILSTSLGSFLDYHQYRFSDPEMLVSLLGVGLVALGLGVCALAHRTLTAVVTTAVLLFFVDLQWAYFDYLTIRGSFVLFSGSILVVMLKWPKHVYPVLTAFFWTMFVVTLALLLLSNSPTTLPASKTELRSAQQPPPLVHLGLDGHIGLQGVPQDIRGGRATHDRLHSFYTRHGFTLFSGAFSRYNETHSALSHAMNFSVSAREWEFVGERKEPWRLTTNMYFNSLVRMGYNIDVVQSRYISLCPDKENGTDDEPVSEAVRCYEYPSDAIGFLRSTHGVSERLDALWSAYLRRSYRG